MKPYMVSRLLSKLPDSSLRARADATNHAAAKVTTTAPTPTYSPRKAMTVKPLATGQSPPPASPNSRHHRLPSPTMIKLGPSKRGTVDPITVCPHIVSGG